MNIKVSHFCCWTTKTKYSVIEHKVRKKQDVKLLKISCLYRYTWTIFLDKFMLRSSPFMQLKKKLIVIRGQTPHSEKWPFKMYTLLLHARGNRLHVKMQPIKKSPIQLSHNLAYVIKLPVKRPYIKMNISLQNDYLIASSSVSLSCW